MIGSDSDLKQCKEGFNLLRQAFAVGQIEDVEVVTASIHRNTNYVLEKLTKVSEAEEVDVIITGAGWANHLTGVADAYLRYKIKDIRIPVVGVAFEDENNFSHTTAASLSISEVPGTQVIFRASEEDDQFVGPAGFWQACRFAIDGDLPEIKQPKPREVKNRMLSEMEI